MTAYMDNDLFRTLTRVKQSKLGVAVGQPNAETLLETELARASIYVQFVTGQPALDADLEPLQTSAGDMPAEGVRTLLRQAIQMRTEQVTFQAQNGYVDDASDDVVTSLSVGSFSQSKAQPVRGAKPRLNSWEALTDILWLLMTPDRYAWWVAFLSGDAALQLGPQWGIEQSIHPDAGPLGGWSYFGIADYALAGSGWQGGGGFGPGDIFPLPVD